MKFLKSLFNNKLWLKVFITFSILLLLFAISLTFLWNRQFVNSMQEESFTQFIRASHDANNHLEEQILSVEQLIVSITSNSDIVSDLKNLETPEAYHSAYKIFTQLRNTKLKVLSGLLFIAENGRIFGVGATYDDNNFKDIPFIDKLKTIPENPQNPTTYVQLNSDVFRLYASVFSEGKYLGVIVADINYKLIHDTFVNQNSLSNTFSLLFDQDEYYFIHY